MQKVGERIFIDVHDYDRIKKVQRDSIVLLDKLKIMNVVLGHSTTKWDEINGAFMLGLTELDVKVNKLCTYYYDTSTQKDTFDQLAVNFDISLWKKKDDLISVSRLYKDKGNV